MNEIEQFNQEKKRNIKKQESKKYLGADFLENIKDTKYTYNFSWLGRPIIQMPQDIIAMQEIIYKVKPDLIIETGIAHGGSLIFSASMLTLLEICEEITEGHVIGVDIDIREHNREEILNHPLSNKITMIEASSIDDKVINKITEISKNYKKVLVCLDSNHTHEHVLNELISYSNLVSVDSYCVVFDTAIEDMKEDSFADRPWNKGNNPKTAVWEFLKNNSNFKIDKEIENKLLITVAPDGYLKRIK